MSARNITFTIVCIIGVLADQLTKAWVVANVELHYGEIPIIDGFLSIVHEQNDGAAFSSFEGMQGMFMVFTIIAVAVLLDLARRLPSDALYMSATLGMIMSGALGNAIDRVRFQKVTDFIRVYTDNPSMKDWLIDQIGTNTYPIFNIADSAILVGVILFLIHSMFLEEAETEPEDESSEDGEEGETGADDVAAQEAAAE